MTNITKTEDEFIYAIHCASCGGTYHQWSLSPPVICGVCGDECIAVKALEED